MSVTTVDRGGVAVSSPPSTRDLYRILLLRKNGSELLVSGESPFFALPCVEIPARERAAENITTAVSERYGLPALCLFALDFPANPTGNEPLYQVMETRDAAPVSPEATYWWPIDSFSDQSFADWRDSLALAQTLQQIREFEAGKTFGPFGKPGWIRDLFSWVQHVIDPCGLRLSGKFRQLNASPTFALLRLETDSQALWFKAVGHPNLREFLITQTLSEHFSGFVPPVLATHSRWNGWLTAEFPGRTLDLDDVPNSCAWEQAARTLAELQIASLGKSTRLVEVGCRDLRISSLLAMIDPLMDVMSELMDQQQKASPPPLSRRELSALRVQIKEALLQLAELGIPDTLGHLDFNLGNILCSPDRCLFIDWAEAYVGCPFFTLEYLRAQLIRLRPQEPHLSAAVVNAYESKWRTLLSSETLLAGHFLARVLAVFGYAAGTEAWRDPVLLGNPSTGAYFRSLTRRIQREMLGLQDRRLL